MLKSKVLADPMSHGDRRNGTTYEVGDNVIKPQS